MKTIDKSMVEEIMIFHDIYPDKELPEIEDKISKLDRDKTISIICELQETLNYQFTVPKWNLVLPFETVLKKGLYGIETSIFSNLGTKEGIEYGRKHIITSNLLIWLLKYTLAYGSAQTPRSSQKITCEDYKKVVDLGLVLAEKWDEEAKSDAFDVENFIYCNYHVNGIKNIAAAFARTYYIFEILDNDKSFFSEYEKEFIDYNTVFYDKYNYSILEFLAVIFLEMSVYVMPNKQQLKYSTIWRSVENLYGSLRLKDIAVRVIQSLSADYERCRQWAIESIDYPWDFSYFLAHPFIVNEEGLYLSISEYTLRNAFFENLFWMVRNCFSKDENTKMAFFGRLFERYIQDLTSASVKKNCRCEYVSEFTFGKNKKKSSDCYVKFQNKLLIVEAKGFSILIKTLFNEDVEKNNKKLFIGPVIEAEHCFDAIQRSNIAMFDDITEIYIASVTMDNINAVPNYTEECIKTIEESRENKNIAALYFNFSIEEYEVLMALLEQGVDIFSTLKKHYNLSMSMPLARYLSQLHPDKIRMTDFMKEIYAQAANEMRRLY